MTNIAQTDFSRLVPYADGRRKSFEELVYQLVRNKYHQEIESGRYKLTPIDDSGGGAGVEFYLTKDSGKKIGWQVKAFDRLGDPQKQQIKSSLATSYRDYADELEEWVLCSLSNFTPDRIAKGKEVRGEQTWFDDDLQTMKIGNNTILPENHGLKLTHWGDSELLALLARFPHVQNYFFDDRALTPEWFASQLIRYQQDRRIATKYIDAVHVDIDEDHQLVQLLSDPEFQDIYNRALKDYEVRENCDYFDEGYETFITTAFTDEEHEAYRQALLTVATPERKNLARDVLDSLDRMCELVSTGKGKTTDYQVMREQARKQYLDFDSMVQEMDKIYHEVIGTKLADLQYDDTTDTTGWTNEQFEQEQSRRENTRNILGFYNVRLDAYLNIFRCFQTVGQSELHIDAAAGRGKTHFAFHAYKNAIDTGKPALFILARDLNSIDEIPTRVSAPDGWQLETLLGALNVAAEVAGKIAPIIIDGLNESRSPHQVWYDGIPRLMAMLSGFPNLVLVTTYRPTYTKLLFDDNYFDNLDSYPFDYPFSRRMIFRWEKQEISQEIVEKYFDYYKITVESGYFPQELFDHPLYLKIFCETKNHDRSQQLELPNINRSDFYKVFNEYIKQCANRIFHHLGGSAYSKQAIINNLFEPLGMKLWDMNARGISIHETGFSRDLIEAYENEDLLMFRDYNFQKSAEELSFTYDMIGGYVIAETLLQMVDNQEDLKSLVNSSDFRSKLLDGQERHPLYDDILSALCVLSFEKDHIKTLLFEIRESDPVINDFCLEAIFYVDKTHLIPKLELIKKFVFDHTSTHKAQNHFLGLSEPYWFDGYHPLNFRFFSDWLGSLDMASRDYIWTERVRSDFEYYQSSIENRLALLRNDDEIKNLDLKIICAVWTLTTTIRELRDRATRLLYWYGRKYPAKLFELLKQFIDCNDIYVTERLLAAAYGIAMAARGLKGDAKNEELASLLPSIAKFLYDSMFASDAPCRTTHLLARDYAKQLIDVVLIDNPDLLSKEEKPLTVYPLASSLHNDWGEASEQQINALKLGAQPIRMDFDIYTINGLIPDRQNQELSKKVRNNIYWRIIDLGYNSDLFSNIDSGIARSIGYDRSYSGSPAGKVDRYGKKYAWIAYFELAGRLSDEGILVDEDSLPVSRKADIGIDPSFPYMPESSFYQSTGNASLIDGDDHETWINSDADLDIRRYFIRNDIAENLDDWILIKARVKQEDGVDPTRDTMIDIAAVLADSAVETQLKVTMQSGNDFRMGMVDGTSDFYTFDGELPWSDYMRTASSEDIVVEMGTKFEVSDQYAVTVMPLFYSSNWESYHTSLNPRGETVTPSKEYLNRFDLRLIPQSSDFCDASGTVRSRTLYSKMAPFGSAKFTYVLRSDLEQFVGDQKLIWPTWMEKRWFKNGVRKSAISHDSDEFKAVEFCRFDFLSDLDL